MRELRHVSRQLSLAIALLAMSGALVACDSGGSHAIVAPRDTRLAESDGRDKGRSTGGSSLEMDSDETKRRRADDPSEKVKALFAERCASCHGATGGKGAVGDITDLKQLVDNEMVMPGFPNKSQLMDRVEAGEMPPNAPLAADEIALIDNWIKLGALGAAESVQRTFVREGDVYSMAVKDLLGAYPDPAERANIRYLTLTHLWNGNVPDSEIVTAGQGINKLLNSLTWNPDVKQARAVNAEKTLYRVDLREFGWDTATWEELIRTYAYLIVPYDSKSLGVLQADTKTSVPVVRADWFLFNASRAPLYYRLLKMPTSLPDLEQRLGLDLAKNIADKRVIRAGFTDSIVSKQNRVIERHEMAGGFFWRSYEFGTSDGAQNIFDRPLGPSATAGGSPDLIGSIEKLAQSAGRLGNSALAFDEDGGEFIFTLPNGLLAFYIATDAGQRLDKIPNLPDEPEIVPGGTCMSCHKRGPLNNDDEVRSRARANPALAASLGEIEQIYIDPVAFAAQVDADRNTFAGTMQKLGLGNANKQDPVYKIAQRFPLALSFDQAAAELGVTRGDLEQALISQPALAELNAAIQGNQIPRDAFKSHFNTLVDILKEKM